MKLKNKLLITLLLVVVSLIGISGSAFAYGKVGQQVDCTNNEKALFPFGFLCTRDNGDDTEMTQITTNLKDSSTTTIRQGLDNTLDVTVGYNASSVARRNSQNGPVSGVLLWTTVDVNDSVFAGWGNDRSGGQVDYACPGASSTGNGISHGRMPIVYNYQNSSDTANTSPAGWTGGPNGNSGGGYGYEWCKDEGRMIYWTLAGDAPQPVERKFTIKLNTDGNKGQQVCLRTNVSVSYGGSRWPQTDVDQFGTNSQKANAAKEGNTASRIAKQSKKDCYTIDNKEPQGNLTVSCSNFSVNAYDPDQASSNVNFFIRHKVGNTNNYAVDYSTSEPDKSDWTSRYDSRMRDGSFQPGIQYELRVYDSNTGDIYTAATASFGQACAGPKWGCDYVNFNYAQTKEAQDNNSYVRADVKVTDSTGHILVNKGYASNVSDGTGSEYYQPLGYNVRVDIDVYYWKGRTKVTYNDRSYHGTIPCYRAQCSVLSVVADNTPGGKVLPGSKYTVTYTIKNLMPDRKLYKQIFDSYSDTHYGPHASSMSSKDGPHAIGTDLDPGQTTAPQTYTATAPTESNDPALNGKPFYFNTGNYVDYWGIFPVPNNNLDPNNPSGDYTYDCGVNVPVYRGFSIDLLPIMNLDDPEDPSSFTYSARVKVTSPSPISAGVNAVVTNPVSTIAGPVKNNGPFGNGVSDIIAEDTSTNISRPIKAGDKYCTIMSIDGDVNEGLIGPGGPGDIYITKTAGGKDVCPPVVNKPFFKVTGNGVSVGSNFKSQSCNGTGILAAYFNYKKDPETLIRYGYGSSAQYQALSKDKNLSFASKQVTAYKSPTELTFANTGAQVAPSGEGDYGGNFGSSPCLPDFADLDVDESIAQPLPAGNNFGGHTFTNADPNEVLIYKTTGDVTITGDVINRADVSPGHAPIFILYTTGNINIAPNVKELYGQYFAQSTGDNGGIISTCANSSGPIGKTDNNYVTCANQLVIRGNFVARKVNLNRTYGSLRDEKPTPGKKAERITGRNGIHKPLVWINNSTGFPAGYKKCQQIVEPSEPRGATWLYENPGDTKTNSTGWDDNWVCLPTDDEDGGLQLTWSRGGAGSPKPTTGSCTDSIGQVIQDAGKGTEKGWSDNYLCINDSAIKIKAVVSFNDPSDAKTLCTRIFEPNDNHAGNVWNTIKARVAQQKMYFCVDKFESGTSTDPVPPKAPDPLLCSVPGAQVAASADTGTCAAEIFKFNPSMYLAKPLKGSSGSNSIKFDSITSLPPVL